MDTATFEDLIQAQRNRVYSYACYVLGNRQDAEDVTQEAFIRLWDRCPATERNAMLVWLQRVVRNLCIDVRRRRGRGSDREVDLAAVAPHELAQGSRGSQPDPERRLVRNERQRALLEALERLPVETGELLWLHYFEGLKYREIAALTAANPTTVKVRVHRARRELRRWLAARLKPEIAAVPVVGREAES
jgi:RNA polymerase sigma-70 factor (ECF subfamily)